MSVMPAQRPGSSRQDYGTPAEFMRAVALKFGQPAWDLAASAENAKAPNWIGADRDSLIQDWFRLPGLLWLNPPFARIEPWARKCVEESRLGARILLLTPASVGSDWHKDHVHGKAFVYFLNGRITFDGTPPNPRTGRIDQYPKDCMVSAFGFGRTGFDVWNWRETLRLARAA